MIDFTKITKEELDELKAIATKAAEKSAFATMQLYTQDTFEKAKLFAFSHRFLVSVYNLISEGELKNEIKILIDKTTLINKELIYHLNIRSEFGNQKAKKKLLNLVESDEVKEIIDFFSVLTERINVIKLSRMKGIILEGKSAEEYKKIFGKGEEWKEI